MNHQPTDRPDPIPPSDDHPPLAHERLDTRSSVYEKLTPEQRAKIERALIDRDPPTYRAVFKKFSLASHGLSFTAFYNYARQVRRRAASARLAELTDDDSNVVDTLPKLLGELLIEYLAYPEEASPAAVHRLTQAYKIALSGRKMMVENDLAEARRLSEENRQLAEKARTYALRGAGDLLAMKKIRRENDCFRRALESRGIDPDALLEQFAKNTQNLPTPSEHAEADRST